MESIVPTDGGATGDEGGPNTIPISDQKCSIFDDSHGQRGESSAVKNETGGAVIDPTPKIEQLTAAEKMMLDFLLEKERTSTTRRNSSMNSSSPADFVDQTGHSISSLTQTTTATSTMERRLPLPPQPQPRSTGRKSRCSKEDRSVLEAIDQLDQIPDDQLMRMLSECQQNEDGDGGVSAGDFLAWWMTQQSDAPTTSRGGGKSTIAAATPISPPAVKKQRTPSAIKSVVSSSVISSSRPTRRSETGRTATTAPSNRPKPVTAPGEPGRILFSFMQDAGAVQEKEQSTECPPVSLVAATAKPGFVGEEDGGEFGRSSTIAAGSAVRAEMNDYAIKKSKSERKIGNRVRRRRGSWEEMEKEDEDRESDSEQFDDDLSEVFEEVLLPKKSTKKKRELVGILWDPEKPRPMPRRLRKITLPEPADGEGQKNQSTQQGQSTTSTVGEKSKE